MSKAGDRKFADVLLRVGPELHEIPASRAILARNCPYFDAMFTSGMSESKTVDMETGELRPIDFPDEDYDNFFLFVKMLYGDVTKFDPEMSVQEFGAFATVMDKYQVDSGPMMAACTELLVSKLGHPDFFKYLVAYRGPHQTRPVAEAVTSGLVNRISTHTKGVFPGLDDPVFVENCTVADLNLVSEAFCRQQSGKLRESAHRFVSHCLTKAIARHASKWDESLPMAFFDEQTRGDQYIVKKTYGVGLNRHRIAAMLDPVAVKFYLDDDMSLFWGTNDTDQLLLRIDFAATVAMCHVPCCDPVINTAVPVDYLKRRLMKRGELKELLEDNKNVESDTEELVYFRVKIDFYYAQTLVHLHLLETMHISGVESLVGMCSDFFDLLASKRWRECLDGNVGADLLVCMLLKHFRDSDSDQGRNAATFGRVFKKAIPWRYVEPERVVQCMRLKPHVTGMEVADWAMIHKLLATDEKESIFRRPDLNTGKVQRTSSEKQFIETVVRALQSKPVAKKKRKAPESGNSNSSSSSHNAEGSSSSSKKQRVEK